MYFASEMIFIYSEFLKIGPIYFVNDLESLISKLAVIEIEVDNQMSLD
jgi:hypothetical protein